MVIWSPLGTFVCCSRSSAVFVSLLSWAPLGPQQDEGGRRKVAAGPGRAAESLTCFPSLAYKCRAAGASVTHTKAIKRDSRSVWHCPVPISKCQGREAWHSHRSQQAWLAEPGWSHPSPARISPPAPHLDKFRGTRPALLPERRNGPYHLERSAAAPCMVQFKQGFQVFQGLFTTQFPTSDHCLPHLRLRANHPKQGMHLCVHSPSKGISAWLKAALPPGAQDRGKLGLNIQQNAAPRTTPVLPNKSSWNKLVTHAAIPSFLS